MDSNKENNGLRYPVNWIEWSGEDVGSGDYLVYNKDKEFWTAYYNDGHWIKDPSIIRPEWVNGVTHYIELHSPVYESEFFKKDEEKLFEKRKDGFGNEYWLFVHENMAFESDTQSNFEKLIEDWVMIQNQ